MTIDPSAQALLAGGGAYLDFKELGTIRQGRIIGATSQQNTDLVTKLPKFYKNGNPEMVLVITVDTGQPTAEMPDGVGRLFLNWRAVDAVRAACRVAGVEGIAVGGTLAVQYIADEPTGDGLSPAKAFRAHYTPPAPGLAAANSMLAPAQAQAQPPAQAYHPPAQPPQAQPQPTQQPFPQPQPAPMERPAPQYATDFPAPTPPAPATNPWGQ